ncbi:hypothetical protein ACN47E_004808 [Coniothyrium glycines]
MFTKSTLIAGFLGAVSAGTTIWDGRFNDMTSSADLEKWSFSNPVGSYQYYIHGTGPVTDYVNLSADFKNPADAASKQGVKITIDDTAKWNSDMWRTELIPQTSAPINKGKVFYHFSIKTSAANASTNEHQIAFFESHFTELKYGGASGTKLAWMVGGESHWSAELLADEWHNVAYEIDFDAGSVALHHSTGSAALAHTAGPLAASTSSNGADWHLGVLRLPQGGSSTAAEDWYFSGVYVERGDLTTAVGSGSAGGDEPAATTASAKPVASSTAVAVGETPAPSTSAVAVEDPVAPSAAPAGETPVAVESPVASAAAPVETPAASSAAPVVETPAAPSTLIIATGPPVAVPTPTGSAGAGSAAQLPEEFTIKQFVAWLKARTGKE